MKLSLRIANIAILSEQTLSLQMVLFIRFVKNHHNKPK